MRYSMLVLAALAAVAWAQTRPADYVDITACRSTVKNLAAALEMFKDDQQKYPQRLDELSPKYLQKLPVCNDGAYSYRAAGGGYKLNCSGKGHVCEGIAPGQPACDARSGLEALQVDPKYANHAWVLFPQAHQGPQYTVQLSSGWIRKSGVSTGIGLARPADPEVNVGLGLGGGLVMAQTDEEWAAKVLEQAQASPGVKVVESKPWQAADLKGLEITLEGNGRKAIMIVARDPRKRSFTLMFSGPKGAFPRLASGFRRMVGTLRLAG